MITKDALNIMWFSGKFHEEVSGLYFYGFWRGDLPNILNSNKLLEIWNKALIEVQFSRWCSDEYNCISVAVYIKQFPPEEMWLKIISNTLQYMISEGSYISWCGNECSSAHLSVFDPRKETENVYAFLSQDLGFVCNSNLNEEFTCIGDEKLEEVYKSLLISNIEHAFTSLDH